jgi:hypothetical protein
MEQGLIRLGLLVPYISLHAIADLIKIQSLYHNYYKCHYIGINVIYTPR